MDADPRIAEWLTEEAPYDDEGGDLLPEEPYEAHDRPSEAPSPEADVVAAPARASRAAASRRTRHLPASLGLAGPEARLLEVVAALGRRIRRRPMASLVVAAGAGFVIGGALTFRAGRLLLAAGARRVARELLKQLV